MENADVNTLEWLIWTGSAVSLLGLAGLVLCILRVRAAKKANLEDGAMRAVLQKVIPLNLGSLFLSVIGLMLVVVGITLG